MEEMSSEVDRLGAYIRPSSATVEASLPILNRDLELPHPSRQSRNIFPPRQSY